MPNKISNEPYLQTFQYKVQNRILNCNERLFKFKIKESKNCSTCYQVDTIEHHLISCKSSKTINMGKIRRIDSAESRNQIFFDRMWNHIWNTKY